MEQTGLSGDTPLGEVKTKARQAEVARDYLKRAARIGEFNGRSSGSDGPVFTALKRCNVGRVLVFVMGAFAEMSGDVSRIYRPRPGVDPRLVVQRRYQAHKRHVKAAHPEGLGAHGELLVVALC